MKKIIISFIIIFVVVVYNPVFTIATNVQSNNANLKNLILNKEGLVPSFKSNIYEYDLIVNNTVNDLEVLPVAENSNSQIEITGNKRFKNRFEYCKNKSNFTR